MFGGRRLLDSFNKIFVLNRETFQKHFSWEKKKNDLSTEREVQCCRNARRGLEYGVKAQYTLSLHPSQPLVKTRCISKKKGHVESNHTQPHPAVTQCFLLEVFSLVARRLQSSVERVETSTPAFFLPCTRPAACPCPIRLPRPVVEVRVPRGPGAVEGKGQLLVVLVLLAPHPKGGEHDLRTGSRQVSLRKQRSGCTESGTSTARGPAGPSLAQPRARTRATRWGAHALCGACPRGRAARRRGVAHARAGPHTAPAPRHAPRHRARRARRARRGGAGRGEAGRGGGGRGRAGGARRGAGAWRTLSGLGWGTGPGATLFSAGGGERALAKKVAAEEALCLQQVLHSTKFHSSVHASLLRLPKGTASCKPSNFPNSAPRELARA